MLRYSPESAAIIAGAFPPPPRDATQLTRALSHDKSSP